MGRRTSKGKVMISQAMVDRTSALSCGSGISSGLTPLWLAARPACLAASLATLAAASTMAPTPRCTVVCCEVIMRMRDALRAQGRDDSEMLPSVRFLPWQPLHPVADVLRNHTVHSHSVTNLV